MAMSLSSLIAQEDPFVEQIDASGLEVIEIAADQSIEAELRADTTGTHLLDEGDLLDPIVTDIDVDMFEVVQVLNTSDLDDMDQLDIEAELQAYDLPEIEPVDFFGSDLDSNDRVPVWSSDSAISHLLQSIVVAVDAEDATDGAKLDADLAASDSSSAAPANNAWLNGVVKPFKSVVVSATLREVIEQINVEEGDRIEAGQALIHLRSDKQRLAVERYELVIRKAEFDYKAAQRLFEQNVSSRDDALNKELELKRLIVEQAIAQAEYDERTIKSSLNGVVVKKLKEAGESVNEVEPILQIVENDRLLLLFYLHADMLPLIKMGQELNTRYPALSSDIVKPAKINFIDPEVDARSGLFRVRLLLDNSDELIKPGMQVQAAFPARIQQPGAGAHVSSTNSL